MSHGVPSPSPRPSAGLRRGIVELLHHNPITILWARASSKTILVTILLFWFPKWFLDGFLGNCCSRHPTILVIFADRDCTS